MIGNAPVQLLGLLGMFMEPGLMAMWNIKYVPSGARWIRGLIVVNPSIEGPVRIPCDFHGPRGDAEVECTMFCSRKQSLREQPWKLSCGEDGVCSHRVQLVEAWRPVLADHVRKQVVDTGVVSRDAAAPRSSVVRGICSRCNLRLVWIGDRRLADVEEAAL